MGIDDVSIGTAIGSSYYVYSDYYIADVANAQDYYPFGMEMPGRTYANGAFVDGKYGYGFNGQEEDDEVYGERNSTSAMYWQYDARLGRRWNIDPVYKSRMSGYATFGNCPILLVDPNGDDWYDINDRIVWRDHEGELKENGKVYKSLGANVIVGYHNRDVNYDEPLNSALFEVYLESNKAGASAHIYGNTVPADKEKSGTMAEGHFPAEFAPRPSYVERGKEDLAIWINKGKDVPSVLPNNNRSGKFVVGALYLHAGNPYQSSLSDLSGNAYSEGCQTTGSYKGSKEAHVKFMTTVGKDFKGSYYLRSKPQLALLSTEYKPVALKETIASTIEYANKYATAYNSGKLTSRERKFALDRYEWWKQRLADQIEEDKDLSD